MADPVSIQFIAVCDNCRVFRNIGCKVGGFHAYFGDTMADVKTRTEAAEFVAVHAGHSMRIVDQHHELSVSCVNAENITEPRRDTNPDGASYPRVS